MKTYYINVIKSEEHGILNEISKGNLENMWVYINTKYNLKQIIRKKLYIQI